MASRENWNARKWAWAVLSGGLLVAVFLNDGFAPGSSTFATLALRPTTTKLLSTISTTAQPSVSGSPWFSLMVEFTGDAGALAQQALNEGRLSGVTFHPSLTTSEQKFLSANPNAAFAYFALPLEAHVSECYPSSTDSNTGSIVAKYSIRREKFWRLAMPEFDQAGGCWSNGRPSPAGLSDLQAYSTWMDFYLSTLQLRYYLNQTAQQRSYKWMSVSDFAFSTQYAYDMGSDAVLLERNEDEMSGITPGLAMVRGAANQHGSKDWGIDISTWRYWNNGPTQYANGQLTTGWSTSTFKRNMFIAYMGGANIVHMEAADYTKGASSGNTLNPLGLTVQKFYDFAIKRHPNRGTPYVPMAIMQDHYSGLEPKFGEWMQSDYKWYWNNPYSPGDGMFARLLSLIYPNYNLWATLPSGSPKVLNVDGSINISATHSAYQQALATGVDPRGWEPMGNSRWGETFDIITNQSPLASLLKYKVIVLATGAPMSDALLGTLSEYVKKGGILVLNASQLSANARTLAGVSLSANQAYATGEAWAHDGSAISESPYSFSPINPTTAKVISQSSGNPIITKNDYGAGVVYLTTPHFLENEFASQIQSLLNSLQSEFAVVAVRGPQLEYLVNTDGKRIIVTLINTNLNGAVWSGTLSFRQPASSYSVSEWIGDRQISSSVQNGQVVINATVPAYDVSVYELDAE